MSAILEARYRWLLRAYPPAYRSDRGDEMIGTLMEAAAPDQRRPSFREALSLAVRGVQTRAGVHGPRARRGLVAGTIRLAVLLLLVQATAVSLARTGKVVTDFLSSGDLGLFTNALQPLETVLIGAALLLVAGGRYGLGLLASATAYATMLVILAFSFNTSVDMTVDGRLVYTFTPWSSYWVQSTVEFALMDTTLLPLLLATLLAIPLPRWRPPHARRPLGWLLAVPVAVIVLPTAFDTTLRLQPWPSFAAMAALLLWATVDARATVAGAVLFLPLVLAPLAYEIWPFSDHGTMPASYWHRVGTYAACVAVLAVAGVLRARRQARL